MEKKQPTSTLGNIASPKRLPDGAKRPVKDWRQTDKKASRKNQIRSVERMLKKEGLRDELRASLEAKLKELNGAVETKTKQELEKKRATKYHKAC